jgi:hypothetical protein
VNFILKVKPNKSFLFRHKTVLRAFVIERFVGSEIIIIILQFFLNLTCLIRKLHSLLRTVQEVQWNGTRVYPEVSELAVWSEN